MNRTVLAAIALLPAITGCTSGSSGETTSTPSCPLPRTLEKVADLYAAGEDGHFVYAPDAGATTEPGVPDPGFGSGIRRSEFPERLESAVAGDCAAIGALGVWLTYQGDQVVEQVRGR